MDDVNDRGLVGGRTLGVRGEMTIDATAEDRFVTGWPSSKLAIRTNLSVARRGARDRLPSPPRKVIGILSVPCIVLFPSYQWHSRWS